jgi:hypothetical protein
MTEKMIKGVLRGVNDCLNGKTCPAVYELTDGRLAVQGAFADAALLAEAGVPSHETIVIIPRSLLPGV